MTYGIWYLTSQCLSVCIEELWKFKHNWKNHYIWTWGILATAARRGLQNYICFQLGGSGLWALCPPAGLWLCAHQQGFGFVPTSRALCPPAGLWLCAHQQGFGFVPTSRALCPPAGLWALCPPAGLWALCPPAGLCPCTPPGHWQPLDPSLRKENTGSQTLD